MGSLGRVWAAIRFTINAPRVPMDSLTSSSHCEQYRSTCTCAACCSSVPSGAPPEGWDYLDMDVLRPARSSRVCMTCQHFRYEVGRHCVSLLTCPIHQGLIPQAEHLTRRYFRWVARREFAVCWFSEVVWAGQVVNQPTSHPVINPWGFRVRHQSPRSFAAAAPQRI